MDKLTPQELCLYFGQDIVSDFADDYKGKLMGITMNALDYTVEVRRYNGTTFLMTLKSNHVKLLLRPLDSITEGEAKELLKLRMPHAKFHGISISSERIYFKFITGSTIIHTAELFFSRLSAEETAFMQRKGFCLFPEWFLQGKAIDKTKKAQP